MDRPHNPSAYREVMGNKICLLLPGQKVSGISKKKSQRDQQEEKKSRRIGVFTGSLRFKAVYIPAMHTT